MTALDLREDFGYKPEHKLWTREKAEDRLFAPEQDSAVM